MRALLEIIEEAGASANIGVYLTNPAAHRLYRSLGFVDVGEPHEWPPGSGRLDQHMTLG